jgi:hypothetical protein
MAGSGTTIATARMLGHHAIGFDTDPLAVLIATAWSADIDPSSLVHAAERITATAQRHVARMPLRDAYPTSADDETCAFLRYWFDPTTRRQLTALAAAIRRWPHDRQRAVLWCAFSRLIIVKSMGASLAMDVAHSRRTRSMTVRPSIPCPYSPARPPSSPVTPSLAPTIVIRQPTCASATRVASQSRAARLIA